MSISILLRIGLISCVLLFMSGCSTMVTKAQKFPRMYEEKPTTIFVLPPINSTTAADAKEYYSTTITQPLANAGFYVFPMEVTGDLLKSQGLYDTELIIDQPLERFHEFFGADAVLFTHIKKWDKTYMVLAASLTVSIDAKLKSTRTNRVLWEYNGTIVADLSGQSSSGNPILDLVVKAVVTSINTAAADYVPYAQLANTMLLLSMPVGKYHDLHDKDGALEIVDQKPGTKYDSTTGSKDADTVEQYPKKPTDSEQSNDQKLDQSQKALTEKKSPTSSLNLSEHESAAADEPTVSKSIPVTDTQKKTPYRNLTPGLATPK